jgi:hypothetical protein
MLKQHSKLFGGALGTLSVKPIRLKVTNDAKPYHAQPFPVPQAYEGVTKKEIERLILIGVLRKCHESEWAAPTFIQPTKKTGDVRVGHSRYRKSRTSCRNCKAFVMRQESIYPWDTTTSHWMPTHTSGCVQ